MANATRTVKVRFDGSAKGLIAAAAKAGIAVEGFERQVRKSSLVSSTSSIGGGLADALGALPSQLKGAAIVAGAGIGAAMAPALASALISGVLLAVGGGVLAAGIVGAAKSPKVVRAWQKFGQQAGKVFERFSAPFVGPLVRAAQAFSAALKRAEPTIVAIGRTLGPVVDRLAPAFALMAERSLPGILAAAQASVPFFDTLAKHLPLIGDATSRFFGAIAAGGPTAQAFFDRFLSFVEGVLPRLGGFITWVAELGPKIDAFTNTRLKPLTDAFKAVGDFISNGLAGAREIFTKWLEANNTKIDRFIVQISGFIKDTGPAFEFAIKAIAFNLVASATAVMEIVNQLDRLKNWYNRNKDWLQIFTILPISRNGGAQLGDLPGRAHGGPVEAGRSYLVGERGPEILRMGARGGYVVPNRELASGSQSATGMPPIEVNVMVELDGEPVGRRVRYEVKEAGRGLYRLATAGAGTR